VEQGVLRQARQEGASTWRLAKVLLTAALGLLVLSACYIPTRFNAQITVNGAGDWTMVYTGTLVYGALAPGLMPDRPTAAQLAERVRNVTADLQRDPGFRELEYLGNGAFEVDYEKSGNIFRQPGITFVRTDSRVLQIQYVKAKEEITVRGNTVPTAQRQWVVDAGLDMQGDLRVVTELPALDHNATTTGPGPNGTTIYLWQIRGVSSPAPRLVLSSAG
jgi:hypothetical protein